MGKPSLDILNGLSPQQDIFVREFHLTSNATQAAIKAGYSEKTADVQGSRLLNTVKVQQALSLLQEETKKTYGIDKDRIIKELLVIAYGRIADCFDWSDGVAKLKPKEHLTDENLAMLDNISFSKSEGPSGQFDRDGNPIMETRVSVSAGSISKQKLAALKMLAQISGIIPMFSTGSGEQNVFNNTQNNLIFVAEWGTGAAIKKISD